MLKMETYSRSSIKDYIQLFRKKLGSPTQDARNHYIKYLRIKQELKKKYNFNVKNKKILDIGCGQRYPYSFLFSKDNEVIGIDLDIILKRHDLRTYWLIISKNGINRFLKTFLRSILYDRLYFKELSRLSKRKKDRQFLLLHMNAENLKFRDNSFEFVLSVLSFEHFRNLEKCVQELKRLL